MFVYKITGLCFNSPVLQGWDLNVPKFQQGIHALIIWHNIRIKRRERRQSVCIICNPAMNDGAMEKEKLHYRQTLIKSKDVMVTE